jgi:hypothetical protein
LGVESNKTLGKVSLLDAMRECKTFKHWECGNAKHSSIGNAGIKNIATLALFRGLFWGVFWGSF